MGAKLKVRKILDTTDYADFSKVTTGMINVTSSNQCWKDYWDNGNGDISPTSQKHLLASEWYRLFSSNDKRSELTWRGRLNNVVDTTKMYNFYSLTEDVLAEYENDFLLLDSVIKYAWVKQEKFKGKSVTPNFGGVSSPYAGYRFNINYDDYLQDPNAVDKQIKSPDQLGQLTVAFIERLKQEPFFMKNIDDLADLYIPERGNDFVGKNANTTNLKNYYEKLQTENVIVRDWLLAEAFPATTWPMGGNNNIRLGVRKNYDISSAVFVVEGVNCIWPRDKYADNSFEWRHSDYLFISYQHNHKLYQDIIGKLSN